MSRAMVPHRWVLLRGLGRESGHWGEFAQVLRMHLGDDHEVLALDLPGCGRKRHLRSPASVAAITQACRRELAALPPGAPWRLVGISLGGMVALEWARSAPQELAGCAVINTSAGGLRPPWERLQRRHWCDLLSLLQPGRGERAREELVLRLTTRDPSWHAAVLRDWARIARERPPATADVLRQLVAAACFRLPPVRPALPLLVLCSGGDALVSPDCSRELARRWTAPLREHPWAGHDLPLEDPRWLARQLARWAADT